jgi:hypothetical protein
VPSPLDVLLPARLVLRAFDDLHTLAEASQPTDPIEEE